MIGIYLLKEGEKVVYVGSSKNVETRVTQHQSDKSKSFDNYQVIGCNVSELANLEAYYIDKYKPEFNKNGRKAVDPDYSNVWISVANKYNKQKLLDFTRECLYFYSITQEEMSLKFTILPEDVNDLFLCRTISMDVLKMYFACFFNC
ncbi:GIY-YIG nuclease family protein [uncultured Chryseobacterium sp.]|uniref:GIY-YIG nuclease family protein n=1 Tax=uncultured Chryseobacterium sp. TaxID=259322 RepID=UPI0025E8FB85|nr:GIY-YIG nuclease family protein [uncultured Chryseobacterium sp.]